MSVAGQSAPSGEKGIPHPQSRDHGLEDQVWVSGGDEYKAFEAFEKQLKTLDEQLRDLSNKARKLGSSVGILSASSRLRERLGRVLYLFRKNAAGLFPQKIPQLEKFQPSMFRRLVSKRHGMFDHLVSQSTELEPKHIALELQLFARDVHTLLECFNQFPEFIDEIPDQAFGDELSHWAASLEDFGDDFESHAVQRYLFYSMIDIGDRLQLLADKFIPVFLKTGIPTVKASQEHSAVNLVNLSTIATLFAGVAATMIQLTYSVTPRNSLLDCVNVLWFISLIFSISAAVNSLLGLTWSEAIYRSPDHRVPWWIRIWIKHSPIVYLVLSVICFFLGFVLFSFSSDQANITRVLSTVFSSVSCCGLLLMSAWFACERWIYHRYEGYMWLSDALGYTMEPVKHFFLSAARSLHPQNVFEQGRQLIGGGQDTADGDPEKPAVQENRIGRRAPQRGLRDTPNAPQKVSFWLAFDKSSMTEREKASHRWQEAIRRTIEARRERLARQLDVKGLFREAGDPLRSGMSPQLRAASVIAHLSRMTITQKLETDHAHDALVRFLQFSRDGRYLATSSWDKKSFILDVTFGKLSHEKSLEHSSGYGFVHQIECTFAVNATQNGERLWSHQRSDEDHPIRSVAWKGHGQESLSVEGHRVVNIDETGKETQHHRVDNLIVRDVTVTSDSRYMLCIGKHDHEQHAQDKPAKASRKKHEIVCEHQSSVSSRQVHSCVIVYDLVNFKVIKRAPVFYEMCDIALASDDCFVLVSYENRAPPQLWEFRNAQGKANNVVLRHTYMPKTTTAFAGLPAIFGGTNDNLILRAGTASDIYVWDRDTTSQLHRIQAPVALKHLTAIAWNRGANEWMFATGTHEGEVHVWTVGPAPEEAPQRHKSASAWSSGSGSVFADVPSSLDGARHASSGVYGEYTQSPVAEARYPPLARQGTDSSSTAYTDDGTVRDEDTSGDDDDD
ncbi:uncharacterized protein PHACADRAFT_205913 [Phanerochaete carnosa HHB-10118-sp]|uniref:Uncharacterized protein n=1 Tax=Phanerochaete carnosa (strain HHB-10118-sp) TaxID=650164 RepID=K5WKK3_PHACS|nr:uncharacterized protein PHACADRAFT_205913 [Phanerochaete carnosa HHB-10118-sp]EKM59689.1 hypothetical protein PHACADRAFT_205913 [Phanerochaete carnosa HHB-10118-sp]